MSSVLCVCVRACVRVCVCASYKSVVLPLFSCDLYRKGREGRGREGEREGGERERGKERGGRGEGEREGKVTTFAVYLICYHTS